MKWVQCAAVLFALVGATSGASLREVMQADLRAELKASTKSKGTAANPYANCRVDNRETDDRTCEASDENNGKARCNDCVQSCHVWGDPHMVTFDSTCAVSVFSQPGRYVFWGQIRESSNQKYIIWAEVQKDKSDMGLKPWIKAAYVTDPRRNGMFPEEYTLVANASDCTRKGEVLFQDSRKMWSDYAAKNGLEKDIDVKTVIKCRNKHGPWQLEIFTEIHDELSEVSPNINALDVFPYSKSTRFFWNDFGACVNPYSFGKTPGITFEPSNLPVDEEENRQLRAREECHRQSALANQAGRVCKCSMECALWGDPHVNSFWVKSSGKAIDSFMMPKARHGDLTDELSFVYQFQNKIAVKVEVDDCELINTVTVYAMKPKTQAKLNGCDSRALTTDWLNSDDFDKFRFVADDVCEDKTDTGSRGKKKRKIVLWPSPEDQDYYDEDLDGMNLGRSVMTQGFHLIPVDVNMNDKNLQSCANNALSKSGVAYAAGDDQITWDVALGTVQVQIKCHNRYGGGFNPFFNLCVNRANIEPAATAGFVPTAEEKERVMRNIEKSSRNSGWCTTGDWKQGSQGASIASSVFQFRQRLGYATPFALSTTDTASAV